MRMDFFENRYGKQLFSRHNELCTGYYRYDIEIFNDDLKAKLNIEDVKKLFYIYDIIPIDKIESFCGMHWLQENYSTQFVSGKIKTCQAQDYKLRLRELYFLFISTLSDKLGYVEGEDYTVLELGFIQLKPAIEFHENYWLIQRSVCQSEAISSNYSEKTLE